MKIKFNMNVSSIALQLYLKYLGIMCKEALHIALAPTSIRFPGFTKLQPVLVCWYLVSHTVYFLAS